MRLAYRRLFPDKVSILEPMSAAPFGGASATPPNAPNDVIVFAGGKIESLDAASGRSLWPEPKTCEAMPTFIAALPHRLIFATLHRVFAVNRTTGAEVWHVGDEPAADARRDSEALAQWTRFAARDERVFCASDRGELIAIDTRDGQVLWRRQTAAGGITHLTASDRHICCALGGKSRGRLLIYNAADGKLIRTIDQPDAPTIRDLAISRDGAICVSTATSWRQIAMDTGRLGADVPIDGACWLAAGIDRAPDVLLTCSRDGLRRFDLSREPQAKTKTVVSFRHPPQSQPWGALCDETLYLAAGADFIAYDARRDRTLWTIEKQQALARPPTFTRDAILFITPHAEPSSPDAERYEIAAASRATGRPLANAGPTPLITPPLASFGGLFVRRNALLVLDGNTLIGYVGREDRRAPGAVTSRPAAASEHKKKRQSNHARPTRRENAMPSPIEIACIVEPNFGENAFVVVCKETKSCWIVDPGLPPSADQVCAHIREHDLKAEAIVLTHGHLDHIAGVPGVVETLGELPIYIAEGDKAALTDPAENLSDGFGAPINVGEFSTRDLPPGSELTLGKTTWRVLDTSGHSPGGRSLYCEAAGIVIVGDALFQGSIGRSDFHHSNETALLTNIREKLLTLPEDTQVLSGHGPVTTVGQEKRYNPFFR